MVVNAKVSFGNISPLRLLRVALFLVVMVSAASCGSDTDFAERRAPDEVTIVRVIDGDTVEISPSIEGIEDVRLIGMDTPEISGDCGREPLADAARDYTVRYVGESMSLRLGRERKDQYGRLLAYLRTPEGAMLNEELLREGLAQVATFPPNVRYEDEFLEVQARAREEGAGIWSLSDERQELLADRGNGVGGSC